MHCDVSIIFKSNTNVHCIETYDVQIYGHLPIGVHLIGIYHMMYDEHNRLLYKKYAVRHVCSYYLHRSCMCSVHRISLWYTIFMLMWYNFVGIQCMYLKQLISCNFQCNPNSIYMYDHRACFNTSEIFPTYKLYQDICMVLQRKMFKDQPLLSLILIQDLPLTLKIEWNYTI